MAVLPGIDANDEAKTAAVFQFYTAGAWTGLVGGMPAQLLGTLSAHLTQTPLVLSPS